MQNLKYQIRVFGLSSRALQFWGNKKPELKQLVNLFEKSKGILNQRRQIVQAISPAKGTNKGKTNRARLSELLRPERKQSASQTNRAKLSQLLKGTK